MQTASHDDDRRQRPDAATAATAARPTARRSTCRTRSSSMPAAICTSPSATTTSFGRSRRAPASFPRWPAPASPDFPATAGPRSRAQLRQPHSIAVDREQRLLICDIGNQRIRRVDLATRRDRDVRRHRRAQPTPDGAPLAARRSTVRGRLSSSRRDDLYLALREGNAIYRIAPTTRDAASRRRHRQAGLLGRRRPGARGASSAGRKGSR